MFVVGREGAYCLLWGEKGHIVCCGERRGMLLVVRREGTYCLLWGEKGHPVCCGERRGILFVVGKVVLSVTGEGAYCLLWGEVCCLSQGKGYALCYRESYLVYHRERDIQCIVGRLVFHRRRAYCLL